MKLGRYIVGLVSGLTFGMLFAPKKGKQLREEIIKKGSSSGQDALVALFTAFRDAGTDAVGEMRKLSENEQIQAALNMSKERMNEYLGNLEDRGYDVAASAQEKLEEISEYAVKNAAAFKKRAVQAKGTLRRTVKEGASSMRKKAAAPKKTAVRRKAAKKSKASKATKSSKKKAGGAKKGK